MQNSNPAAAPRCQHIKANGRICASPALRGQPFCYNHDRAHHPPAHPRKYPEAFIPLLENGQAMVIAITNISRAVCSGELDESQANTLFKGLRLLKTAFESCYSMGSEGPEAQVLTEGMADVLARAYAPPPEPEECDPVEEKCDTADARKCGTDIPVCGRRAATESTPSPEDRSANKICPSPIANLPLDAPLTDRQVNYCRFVLRYGPMHPEFNDCSRRLEPETPSRVTA